MSFIKENYKAIIFCVLLLTVVIAVALLNNKSNNDPFVFEYKTYLKDYEINEVIPIYKSADQIAKKYLSHVVELAINDPDGLFDITTDAFKESFNDNNTFDDFLKALKTLTFCEAKVKKYAYYYDDVYKSKCMRVIDADDNTFIFVESSINNYKVVIE